MSCIRISTLIMCVLCMHAMGITEEVLFLLINLDSNNNIILSFEVTPGSLQKVINECWQGSEPKLTLPHRIIKSLCFYSKHCTQLNISFTRQCYYISLARQIPIYKLMFTISADANLSLNISKHYLVLSIAIQFKLHAQT